MLAILNDAGIKREPGSTVGRGLDLQNIHSDVTDPGELAYACSHALNARRPDQADVGARQQTPASTATQYCLCGEGKPGRATCRSRTARWHDAAVDSGGRHILSY